MRESPESCLWPGPPTERARVDVVGLGEISCDQICEIERLPAPGDKQDLASLTHRAGGQVATTLLGCARLGLRTRFLGAVASPIPLAP